MESPVLLFDGDCSLCSRAVQFVLEHERDDALRFAPLGGAFALAAFAQHGLDRATLDSLVVVRGAAVFVKSDAALEVARHLGPWRALRALRIVPRPLRDALYDWVARNRYRWFGKRDACFMPQPQHAGRFLDV